MLCKVQAAFQQPCLLSVIAVTLHKSGREGGVSVSHWVVSAVFQADQTIGERPSHPQHLVGSALHTQVQLQGGSDVDRRRESGPEIKKGGKDYGARQEHLGQRACRAQVVRTAGSPGGCLQEPWGCGWRQGTARSMLLNTDSAVLATLPWGKKDTQRS